MVGGGGAHVRGLGWWGAHIRVFGWWGWGGWGGRGGTCKGVGVLGGTHITECLECVQYYVKEQDNFGVGGGRKEGGRRIHHKRSTSLFGN